MSKPYTIRRRWVQLPYYDVLNPSGVVIAPNLSWRVARKIADLYNADVEWRRHKAVVIDIDFDEIDLVGRLLSGVSLQEEA